MTTYYLNIYPDGLITGDRDEDAARRDATASATRIAYPVEVPDLPPPVPEPGSVWMHDGLQTLVVVDRVERRAHERTTFVLARVRTEEGVDRLTSFQYWKKHWKSGNERQFHVHVHRLRHLGCHRGGSHSLSG